MKKLDFKPCQLCGNPVTRRYRLDRKSFYYPRRCDKCYGEFADPSCHKKKGRRGKDNARYLPIGSTRLHKSSGIIYRKIKIADPNIWMYEHRWVMEQHLGRKLLTNELVHHRDENTLNNELKNLLLISHTCHTNLHLVITEWSLKYPCCKKCGTISKKHLGHGLCSSCYQKPKLYIGKICGHPTREKKANYCWKCYVKSRQP